MTVFLCRNCGTPYATEQQGVECDCDKSFNQKPLKVDESRSYWMIPKLFNGAKVEYRLEGTTLKAYEGHRTVLKRYMSMLWNLNGAEWVFDESVA